MAKFSRIIVALIRYRSVVVLRGGCERLSPVCRASAFSPCQANRRKDEDKMSHIAFSICDPATQSYDVTFYTFSRSGSECAKDTVIIMADFFYVDHVKHVKLEGKMKKIRQLL